MNIYFLNKEFYEIGFKLKDFGNGRNLKEFSCFFFDIHICTLNENEFIFIKEIFYEKRLNEMSIDKFILNEKICDKANIQNNLKYTNNQKEKYEINIPKIKDLKTFDIKLNNNKASKESKKENKDLQKLIRYDCKANRFYMINMFETLAHSENFFSDYIILKKKYFIIIDTLRIIIYNLSNLKIIKEYFIIPNYFIHPYSGKRNKNINIIKWNSSNDNMFLLVIKNKCINLTLFEFNELNEEILISLKVIGYTYILNNQDIYKYEDKNRFYQIDDNYVYIY